MFNSIFFNWVLSVRKKQQRNWFLRCVCPCSLGHYLIHAQVTANSLVLRDCLVPHRQQCWQRLKLRMQRAQTRHNIRLWQATDILKSETLDTSTKVFFPKRAVSCSQVCRHWCKKFWVLCVLLAITLDFHPEAFGDVKTSCHGNRGHFVRKHVFSGRTYS